MDRAEFSGCAECALRVGKWLFGRNVLCRLGKNGTSSAQCDEWCTDGLEALAPAARIAKRRPSSEMENILLSIYRREKQKVLHRVYLQPRRWVVHSGGPIAIHTPHPHPAHLTNTSS